MATYFRILILSSSSSLSPRRRGIRPLLLHSRHGLRSQSAVRVELVWHGHAMSLRDQRGEQSQREVGFERCHFDGREARDCDEVDTIWGSWERQGMECR